jgi:HAD superfamily hydrolase (TIGR01509 family)
LNPSIECDTGTGLVIFDCDGVLIDSELLASHAAAELLGTAGVAITPAVVRERYTGTTMTALVRDLGERHGAAVAAHFDAGFATALMRRFEAELRAIAGIEAVIDALAVPCCVASSSSPERLAHSLTLTGLHARFAPRIYSATQVARGKPAPDLFLFAACAMGVPPARCIVVEDSVAGVQAGRAAGMVTIGFCGGGHCGEGHAARLQDDGAHEVCADARELGALLRAHGAIT